MHSLDKGKNKKKYGYFEILFQVFFSFNFSFVLIDRSTLYRDETDVHVEWKNNATKYHYKNQKGVTCLCIGGVLCNSLVSAGECAAYELITEFKVIEF